MRGLAALQPVARPVRRPPSTALPRRGRVLAALPCGCRCGRRHLLGASSAAALLPLIAPPSCGCRCGRRHLLGASSAAALLLLIAPPSRAAPPIDPDEMVEQVHPSRPDWYEKFYAMAMDKGMKSYEAQIAGYKAKLFSQVTVAGKNILELGVGTGPNFKYYANETGINVIGVDPNKQMEDYARTAAVSAGLPSSNFTFRRGVAESLPADGNSLDVVVGTLVLCSVSNTDMALQEIYRVLKPGGLYLFIEHVSAPDGSFLRLVQGALDPLQQFVADGCHLTRKTGENIRDAGFSSVSMDSVRLSNSYIISPHVYGVACK